MNHSLTFSLEHFTTRTANVGIFIKNDWKPGNIVSYVEDDRNPANVGQYIKYYRNLADNVYFFQKYPFRFGHVWKSQNLIGMDIANKDLFFYSNFNYFLSSKHLTH